jgi:hypothetical protein
MSGVVTATRTEEQREQLTRAVLTSPIEQSNARIAERLGISAEAVRKIRSGRMYANLCLDLDRLERNRKPGSGRTCTQCTHWKAQVFRTGEIDGQDIRRDGYCTLGIPEAENVRYGRGCGAFAEVCA